MTPISLKFFKKRKRWEVTNISMYGLMILNGKSVVDIADEANNYLYKDVTPRYEKTKINISKVLNAPVSFIFSEIVLRLND